jgi:hypothetical protein
LLLRLSEGLGFSARGRGVGCICVPGIVLPAPRYGKSRRGTPRLWGLLVALHGASGLAALTNPLNSSLRELVDAQGDRLGLVFIVSRPRAIMSEEVRCCLQLPPLAASSCVWTGRCSRRPQLKSRCLLARGDLASLAPRAATLKPAACPFSWLFVHAERRTSCWDNKLWDF